MVSERKLIEEVVEQTLADGKVTSDLTEGDGISTSAYGDLVAKMISEKQSIATS